MGKRIPDLDLAAIVNDTDEFEISQAGVTFRAPASLIRAGLLPLSGGTLSGNLVGLNAAFIGNGSFTGTFLASGNAQFGGTVNVVGVATIGGNLNVTGDGIFAAGVSVGTDLAVSNSFTSADVTTGTVYTGNVVSTGDLDTLTNVNCVNVIASGYVDAGSYIDALNYRVSVAALSYAATVDLDFAAAGLQTLALTGDVTFTTSNRASGRSLTVKILADASTRALTFPSWVFVGAMPADLAAGKTGVLSITCFGANDADIVAAYSAQA